MAHATLFDLLWITVDPDAKICSLKEGSKKLTSLCAEKLVIDVLLVKKYCHKLPKSIHLLVFATAAAKKRTLSIEQLMRFCPHETLQLPIPDFLRTLHTISQVENSSLEQEFRDFTRISMTMLFVFFDLIKENSSNSSLQTLDLGLFPLRNVALVKIHEFLFKERAKIPLFTKSYTLKCTIAIESTTDLHLLKVCAQRSTSLGFHLDIIGVYFYNNFLIDVEAVKLFDFITKPNLQLITFSFASLVPNFNLFFGELKFFKFVKYLNLSYLTNLLASETDTSKLAFVLAELTSLQRLVLKGINLNGVMTTLFLECCKRNQSDISVTNCCLLHGGSLHHLDISSCKLMDKDIEFLKEMALTSTLKYLDISENSLNEKRTFEILLCLKYSIQALNISSCFKHLIDYDDGIMPFSAFTQLKYLNIKDLHIPESSNHLLEHELQKMPSLEIIETSIPISLNSVIVC